MALTNTTLAVVTDLLRKSSPARSRTPCRARHAVPRAAALAKTFRQHDLPVVLINVAGCTDAGSHGGTGALPAG